MGCFEKKGDSYSRNLKKSSEKNKTKTKRQGKIGKGFA